MLNKIIFEGIVTNTWRYGSDLFVRVASYRDPNYPTKRLSTEARDEPDYVNVRFTNGAQGQLDFAPGTQLRVEGLLQSREYSESLAEFIDKAKKANDGPLGVEITSGKHARHIMCGRSTVEILALQHVVIQLPRFERNETRKPMLKVIEKVAEAKAKEAPAVAEVEVATAA